MDRRASRVTHRVREVRDKSKPKQRTQSPDRRCQVPGNGLDFY